ncbi:hypothetical protein AYO20_11681 [Fonsecaea nubica]|uniref:Uncharacterized protein n=1 Tax=Fonsecaea nubica TaxID=856822 RepID=A0A178BQY1_9EURO|nr:hypothetical protein AYO20_11681 [Fonsecaea nubica]OAL19053.1 hypothetical protein AYO20_11681 [Fonsecaea nubica]
MSRNPRALQPKPPTILPNPTSMSTVGRGNQYRAPNAGTIDNQPVLTVKHPDNIREVSIEDAIATVKYRQIGDIRDFIAQRVYDLTKNLPNAKEAFRKCPRLLGGKRAFNTRRDRRAEIRNKLLSDYSRPSDMKVFNHKCKEKDVPTPKGGFTKLPV